MAFFKNLPRDVADEAERDAKRNFRFSMSEAFQSEGVDSIVKTQSWRVYYKIETFDVNGTGRRAREVRPRYPEGERKVILVCRSHRHATELPESRRKPTEATGASQEAQDVNRTIGQVLGLAGLSFRLYLEGVHRLGRPAQTGFRTHRSRQESKREVKGAAFSASSILCAYAGDASFCTAQVPIFGKKKPVDKSTDTANTAEPDKILYDRASDDMKHGKYEAARLGMQTLINTYPDSEYLAKAKLAIADSYYKEGGSSNTTQAIAGYKDFIVFFPFLPEAAYAQMQVAMCNYNEMPKADRDNTHAKAAEDEFQIFLTKYPKDPLAPEAQQRLREVQEILAEAQFRIAYYYYIKGDKRAAAGRLIPLVNRYPLYSKTDERSGCSGIYLRKASVRISRADTTPRS